jgi:hypothetical protein
MATEIDINGLNKKYYIPSGEIKKKKELLSWKFSIF